jgi:hypothetical protein
VAREDAADAGFVAPSDIAEIGGVSRAAVSNWRKRRDDFPRPVAGSTAKPLFDRAEVMRWLVENGRTVQRDVGEVAVWSLVNRFRDELPVDLMTDLVLAFLCVRKLAIDFSDREALRSAARGGQVLDGINAVGRDSLWNALVWDTVQAVTDHLSHVRQEDLYRFLNDLFFRVDDLAVEDLAQVGDWALSRFSATEGRTAGSHGGVGSTASRLLAAAASPATGTVYDPACGIGEALLQVWQNSAKDSVYLIGHDNDLRVARIARQRCFLHGAKADITSADVLMTDPDPDLRADVIVAEPPFGMSMPPNFSITDGRWALAGPPPRSNSETAWLQHVVGHLREGGRGYVLTTMTTTFTPAAAKTRRALLRAGCVEAIIALPPKTLQHTAIPTALWVLRPAESPPPKTVMVVDASSAEPSADLASWTHTPMSVNTSSAPDRVAFKSVALNELMSDDDADLNPKRWVEMHFDVIDIARRHRDAHADLSAALALVQHFHLGPVQPKLPPSHVATVRQLEAQDALRVLSRGPAKTEKDGDETDPRVVTTQMVRDGLPPLPPDISVNPDKYTTSPGDILATTMRTIRTVVDVSGGRTLRPGVIRIWCDPAQFDPAYVAECLAAQWNQRFEHGSSIPHASIRDLEIPLIPLAAQRAIAEEVQLLKTVDQNARRVSAASEKLAAAFLDAVRFNVELHHNTPD